MATLGPAVVDASSLWQEACQTSDFIVDEDDLADNECGDAIADPYDDDVDFWEAISAARSTQPNDPQGLTWTVDRSGENPSVAIGKSQAAVFEAAKNIFSAYRENVQRICHKSFEQIDPMGDIIDLFWGPNKPLASLVKRRLCLNDEELNLFLGTLLVQQKHNTSIDDMFEKDGRLVNDDLMPEDQYRACWELIGMAGNGKSKQFWQEFEIALNDALRDISVLLALNLMISLDDDKKKADLKKDGDMQGLNRHVFPDRRKGIVAHTAVCPATLLALGICWEKEGESSYECYVRLVKEIFGDKPNLDRRTFYSDRGYWIKSLLEYILDCGADVHGTVRRQNWFKFTYDQDLKAGDDRIKVDKAGPSSLMTATTTASGRSITANAHRTGTGNVALTMSSLVHGNAWELVAIGSKSIYRNLPADLPLDKRFAAVCRPFRTNNEMMDDALASLGALGAKVEHVTERQGHCEWHHLRRFAITSTGAYRLIPLCSRNVDLAADSDWNAVMEHLDVNGGWMAEDESDPWAELRESAAASEANEEDATTGAEGANGDEDGPADAAGDRPYKAEVEGMLRDATDSTERSAECRRELIEAIRSGNHAHLLTEMAIQMGGSSRSTNKKELAAQWLEDPSVRPFLFLTVPELKAKYRASISTRIPASVSRRDDFIAILSGKRDAPVAQSASGGAPKTPLEAAVSSAFLKPITSGPARELMQIGHEMESVYGEQVLDQSKGDGILTADGKRLVVDHLFRTGLVQKRGKPHQKDSPDFVALGSLDGEAITAAVEMKARCKTTTNDAERQRTGYGEFITVSCRDRRLRRYLLKRSEALQCAHHASTLSVNYVLFVTGDRIGTTGGVLIHYDDDFLSSYEKCIDDAYEASLKWAYDPSVAYPEEEIKVAIKKASVTIDAESFKRAWLLWREMSKPENLPVPACSRIIPEQSARWNITKHGSDAMTQDCQRVKFPLPVQDPQAKAIVRMITVSLHQCWKGAQIFSTNKDLEKYSSLHSYRSSASKALTFKQWLGRAEKVFLRRGKSFAGTPEASVSARQITPMVVDATSNGRFEKVTVPGFVARETGLSPKRKHLRNLQDPSRKQHYDRPAKRFKHCPGVFVERTTADGDSEGAGAEGRCIDCNAMTRWYCVGCRNWVCHDRMRNDGAQLFQDSFSYKGKGNKELKITGVYSCAMNTHPQFLQRIEYCQAVNGQSSSVSPRLIDFE